MTIDYEKVRTDYMLQIEKLHSELSQFENEHKIERAQAMVGKCYKQCDFETKVMGSEPAYLFVTSCKATRGAIPDLEVIEVEVENNPQYHAEDKDWWLDFNITSLTMDSTLIHTGEWEEVPASEFNAIMEKAEAHIRTIRAT